jgi:hypothetical protein
MVKELKKQYDLSFMDRAILAAFDQWINANPNGGTFQYHDLKLIVTKKQA